MLRVDVGYSDRARAKEFIGTSLQILMQLLHTLDKRKSFVESVIITLRSTSMGMTALESDADFYMSTLATINLHISCFANCHKIGANAFMFNEHIAGDAVAPLLNVTEIIERPILRQS